MKRGNAKEEDTRVGRLQSTRTVQGRSEWSGIPCLHCACTPGFRLRAGEDKASSHREICSLQSCNPLLSTIGGTRLCRRLGSFTPRDARVHLGQRREHAARTAVGLLTDAGRGLREHIHRADSTGAPGAQNFCLTSPPP